MGFSSEIPEVDLQRLLSIIFLGAGTVAAGLLYGEENGTKAIILFWRRF